MPCKMRQESGNFLSVWTILWLQVLQVVGLLAPQGLPSGALKESHILTDRADGWPEMALEAADMEESSLGRTTQMHNEWGCKEKFEKE